MGHRDAFLGVTVLLLGDSEARDSAALSLRGILDVTHSSTIFEPVGARTTFAIYFCDLEEDSSKPVDVARELRRRGVSAAAVIRPERADLIRLMLALADVFRYVLLGPLGMIDLMRLIEKMRLGIGVTHDAVSAFAMTYQLSFQETRLLRAAVDGLNNDEAADVMGCRRATVSTYWNRIFSKTAQRGQRDVLAAILRDYIRCAL